MQSAIMAFSYCMAALYGLDFMLNNPVHHRTNVLGGLLSAYFTYLFGGA